MEQKQAIVSITDKAAEKVRALMEQEGEEDLALRIGVRPGGCSGFQYSIYFDDEIGEDDEHERCTQFLRDSSAEAADELLA